MTRHKLTWQDAMAYAVIIGMGLAVPFTLLPLGLAIWEVMG